MINIADWHSVWILNRNYDQQRNELFAKTFGKRNHLYFNPQRTIWQLCKTQLRILSFELRQFLMQSRNERQSAHFAGRQVVEHIPILEFDSHFRSYECVWSLSMFLSKQFVLIGYLEQRSQLRSTHYWLWRYDLLFVEEYDYFFPAFIFIQLVITLF